MPPSRADLAKIHIAKKELGLTDEAYRGILRVQFKKDSAAKLTPSQAFALIRHMQGLGWKPQRQAKLPGLSVPDDGQSKKILALWITLHRAGKVRNGSDQALMAFVKRQTGIAHLQWCSKADKNKVIEALKIWDERHGTASV